MPHIAGTFDSAPLANQAITELLSAGLTKDDISIIMAGKTKDHFTAATKDTGDRVTTDTAVGAGAGGIVAALFAGLTTIGSIVVPGAQVFAVGPIISMLSGFGAGAVVGGLAGALTGLGVASAEFVKYDDELKAGKVVIIAHTETQQQDLLVRGILLNQGAMLKSA